MAKFVVLDTETGGLDPATSSIFTLGAVVVDGEEIVGTFSVMINEGELHFTEEALRVNGLTTEKIKATGVSPARAVEQLIAWLGSFGLRKDVLMAGHNTAFDLGFMKRLFRLAGKDIFKTFSYRTVCTQTTAMFLNLAGVANFKKTSLDALCSFYGIVIREGGATATHDATEDATATAKLLVKLMQEVQIREG